MFRKDGTFVREISVLKESAPGTIGSIVKWPDAAQTYLLVVDDPNGEFHVINRADGKLMGSYGRVGHQLGEFYNLHFIGIDSKGNVYSAEVQGKRVQKFRNLGGLNKPLWNHIAAVDSDVRTNAYRNGRRNRDSSGAAWLRNESTR